MNNPAAQTMLFEANKRSVGVAYLLWLFLCTFGAHRFYVGRTKSAIGQIILHLAAWALLYIGVGFILFFILGIWVLIDAFLIPGWIRTLNTSLANSLSATNGLPPQ